MTTYKVEQMCFVGLGTYFNLLLFKNSNSTYAEIKLNATFYLKNQHRSLS